MDKYLQTNLKCQGVIDNMGNGEYLVRGKVPNTTDTLITYWAANPPTYTTSYAGSGLPYSSPMMAYENTPNKGSVRTKNGEFSFRVQFPNAYYVGLGTIYVKPHLNIKFCNGTDDDVHKIELGDGIPFRALSYGPPPLTWPRYGPNFYSGRDQLEIRTQEQILRESAFPTKNVYPVNFWGTKPPQ